MSKSLVTLEDFKLKATLDGKNVSMSAFDDLLCVDFEESSLDPVQGTSSGDVKVVSTSQSPAIQVSQVGKDAKPEPEVTPLPAGEFRVIEDHPQELWKSSLPKNVYLKWVAPPAPKKVKSMSKKSRSASDQGIYEDGVEYQVDEVDVAWLELINNGERKDLPPVSLDVMELYMDRLEKESFLQMQSTGVDQRRVVDDDAVCGICLNGDCTDTDMIIFCDVCNTAVHQECYGVRYIPEGQWVCRRCLVSPSREVDCVLCPNKGGAFKQTDDGRWAHVACALWIPEVYWANTTFLEPVEGIEYIPPARWRLTCFICKCKGEGACIQCHKTSCYVAFHVTCAQVAGIFMRMEAVFKGNNEIIKKIAYCNNHAPNDHVNRNMDSPSVRSRLKECRRMLAEKRNCKTQTLSVPEINPKTLEVISTLAKFPGRDEFMKRLVSYWKLKRSQRIGVPLLPSLQAASTKPPIPGKKEAARRKKKSSEDTENTDPKLNKRPQAEPATGRGARLKFKPSKVLQAPSITLKRLQKSALATGRRTLSKMKATERMKRKSAQLADKKVKVVLPSGRTFYMSAEDIAKNKKAFAYIWNIRLQLERARMLCELTRNRDRQKARLIRMQQEIWSLTNMPFSCFVTSIIDSLIAKDSHRFFTQPVDPNLVADYLQVIANPMDLGSMKEKATNFYYDSLMELKSDFDLMIDNCIQYNVKDTIYYKVGQRLRTEGSIIFHEADKMCSKLGFGSEQRLYPGKPESDSDEN